MNPLPSRGSKSRNTSKNTCNIILYIHIGNDPFSVIHSRAKSVYISRCMFKTVTLMYNP